MIRILTQLSVILLVVALLVPAATAVVESKTGKEYPDEVVQECGSEPVTLVATGVGLREKTFMKVDVYTIVSYVQAGVELGEDPASALVASDQPKRLRMDLRRSFSRDKLVNAFTEVIAKNYDDQSPFQADLDIFMAYFDRDAQDGDVIIFDFCPGIGLITTLNGEEKGTIDNPAFVAALWTVWFGEEPANKGMRKKMLAVLGE